MPTIQLNPKYPVKTAELLAKKYILEWSNEAVNILSKVRGSSQAITARNLWQYCRSNIVYTTDPIGKEIVKSPKELLKTKRGDCEDFAVLIASAILEMDSECILRIVQYRGYADYNHIYVIWQGIAIDPVNNRFNKELPYIKKKDFKVCKCSHKSTKKIIWRSKKVNGLGRIGINPEDARKSGCFVESGNRYCRQTELKNVIFGRDTEISFSFDVAIKGRYALISADQLQPSHLGAIENPLHFIPEAQPRNRAISESGAKTPIRIAEKLRPAEISEGSTAYTGTPIVNNRGEVIQGNGRAYTMKYYWENFGNDPKGYGYYLKENKKQFGLDKIQFQNGLDYLIIYTPTIYDKSLRNTNPLKVKIQGISIKKPVLVRIVDVADSEAIKLGQYKQADLEAVSTKANDTKSRLNLLNPEDLSRVLDNVFANVSPDDSIAKIIRESNLLTQMIRLGAIRPDEIEVYAKNGTINEAGVKKIQDILVNLIFKGEDTNLPDIFELLPSSLQTAIVKSTPSILRTPPDKSIKSDIAQSIFAYREYRASGMQALNAWVNQSSMFGESPAKKYSPLALQLVEIYDKSKTQREIVETFALYQKAVTDSQGDMFSGPIKGLSKSEGISKVFGVKIREPKESGNFDLQLKAKALRIRRLRIEVELSLK